MFQTDTIAAIATAVSDSGIGIIRLSGSDAITIANSIFHFPNAKKSLLEVDTHTIHYGFIYDGEELVDEVMVSVMKAPRTYTREDVVEINCHGGVLVMNRVLQCVLQHGAKLAEPGEFTKRAFLNGRIDLSKAEAVMDLIHSKSELAMKSSLKQIRGNISDCIRALREKVIYEIAFIESALDDPEHISLDGYPSHLSEVVDEVSSQIMKLLSSCDKGKLMKDGISTVIVGKPNAGKSSFLNAMIGEEKAIVTNIAGTTRDIIEETVRLKGINLNLIDTAGIRDTSDVVEKIGVDKAREYANNADLILFVIDSSVPLDENDKEILSFIKDKKVVVLLNKSDLASVVSEEELKAAFEHEVPVIKISAKHNLGLDEFEAVIQDMFFAGDLSLSNDIFITNQRHKEALQNALSSLQLVKQSLEDDMPEDFYSIDLMACYSSLGLIIGEEVEDDLITEIFSKFCMGK